jgi:hypothetical protein
MNEFRFYHPIEVRYSDLDPQGHVNNAKFLTYLEQARIEYIGKLGLWDGSSFPIPQKWREAIAAFEHLVQETAIGNRA